MAIDKALAKTIAQEIEAALQPVAERHGLEVSYRGGSYDANTFKPRIEFATADKGESEFRELATMLGLEPDDYGKEIASQGRTFVISGVAPKSWKRPVLATEKGTDRVFKFTVDGVKQALGRR